MKIEVKTYEESRLEFFKDLARKAEKKLDKCIRAMKQSDYDNPLSENNLALDDAIEKKSFYCDIVDMLYTDKPADVVEGVHGKWITQEEAEQLNRYDLAYTCSVCGHLDWDCTESETFNYCPNCGAKMDGERREE